MEDADLVMLLYSVILMNQNTSKKKVNLEDFGLNLILGKKEKRSLSKSSQEVRLVDKEPF